MNAVADAEHFLYAYNLNADGSGINALDIVKKAIENEKGVWVEQSEIGKFLGDQAFKDRLHEVSGLQAQNITQNSTEFNKLLYGTPNHTNGTRSNGLWDIASKNYVEDSNGIFRVVAPHAGSGTTLALTESKAIIDRIDAGFPVEIRGTASGQLQALVDDLMLKSGDIKEAVTDFLKIASVTAANNFDVVLGDGSSAKLASLIDDASDVVTKSASKLSKLGPVGDAVVGVTFTGLALAGVAAVGLVAGVTLSAPVAAVIGLVAAIGGSLVYGEDAKNIILDLFDGLVNPYLNADNLTQILNHTRLTLANQGIGYGIQSPALPEPAQNPTIFDLTTDPAQLSPEDSATVGSTTDGWGLLQSGAGWQAKMVSNFVNDNGLVNTSGSNIVAESRIGNVSPNDTAPLVDGVRSFNFNDSSHSDSTAVTLVPGQASSEPGTVTFTVDNVPGSFSGIIHYDAQNNPISVTPDAGQNVTVKLGYGQEVILDGSQDLVFSSNQTQNTDGSFNLAGWFLVDPQNSAYQLKLSKLAKNIAYTDPLSLDSGNDGIRFSAQPGNFDLDSDGVAESIRWTSPADPLLVLDANHDGRINNGSELVDLTGTAKPINLLSLDNNGDGILNAADGNAFTDLQLWQDRNQDGYASTEERQTLTDVGITSIELNPVTDTVAGIADVQGVIVHYSDGSQRTLWDVPLQPTTTASVTTTAYTPSIDKITGSGQTALVAKSAFGVTLDLNNSGADQAIGFVGDDTLIGTDNNDWLTGGAGSDTFVAGAGSDILIIDADDRQDNIDAGSGIDTLIVADDRSVLINLAKINIEVVYGGYGNDVLVGGGSDNYFIAGAAGDDLIIGGRVDDVLSGEDGNDVIDGGLGDDLIRGHRGKDQLFGGYGNDVLDGGLGDDDLQGGNGNDILIESSGNDHYDGGMGSDLLQLNGELQNYTFTQNSDQSYTVINHTAEQMTQMQVSNIEWFSFKQGQRTTTLKFGLNNPLPVNDKVSVASADSSYIINTSSLLSNDIDFQHLSSPQLVIYWVGDAVGGNVSLNNGQVIFTATEAYSGEQAFNYKVRDTSYTRGPVIADTADSAIRGEMKGRVLLVPDNAPSDPEYAKQWYLGAVGANKVWQDYTGAGIKVLVLEPSGDFAVASQAADLNHPDLVANQSTGFNNTLDHSAHGTQVAGVIGAARNGIGGVGVAYDVVLDSIGFEVTNKAYSFRRDMMSMQNYDVVNNSWVRTDFWGSVKQDKLSLKVKEIEEAAIKNAVFNGRNGLGTVMVFGAGNDRAKGRDAGLSTLTANPFTINIAAFNKTGDIGSGFGAKVFSNRGANLLLAAPGSNISSSSIQFETANGSVIGSDYKEANGTSFAAPIISGVVALMLEANPKLTYRDVQTILAVTARQDLGDGIQAETVWNNNGNMDWNGSGMHFSHDFGFGRVDALAAVRMAETWTSQGRYLQTVKAFQTESVAAVADLGQQIIHFNITDSFDVDQVVVKFKLDHTRWSDLVVTLVSPDGTRSILLDRTGVQDGKVHSYNPGGITAFNPELMSVHFRGEQSVGDWQLIIEDQLAGSSGSGHIYADLNVIGTQDDSLKRYILTDEYAGGWVINPDSAKQTELNASALSNGQSIDLSGSSLINGKLLTFNAGIDRLIGTGSNDTLMGADGNETLIGGRGADLIYGRAGDDQLMGGQDNDVLWGENGHDLLAGEKGNDTLYGGAGQDLLIGGEGEDSLYGGRDADVFLIEAGNQGVTTVKDFNSVEGDSILLRTPESFTWGDLNQQVNNGNLLLSFTINQQLREVNLEGVSAPLSTEQVRFLFKDQSVSKDEAGGYTSRNIIRVVPYIESVKMDLPNKTRIDLLNDISAGTLFIVDKNGSGVIKSTDVPNVSAQPTYHIKTMKWTAGTAGADLLFAGTSPIYSPDQRISQQEWQQAIQDLGSRMLNGMGGNDKIIGDASAEILVGGSGYDSLTGGSGNDTLSGGSEADEFIFNSDHGQDTITDLESIDILHFQGISIQATQLDYRSDRYDELQINTTLETGNDNTLEFSHRLDVAQIGSEEAIALYKTQFADGLVQSVFLDDTTITESNDLVRQQQLGSKTFSTLGGNDIVFALKQNGLNIHAGNGNDIIYALEGGNTLYGDNGDDRIELIGTGTAGGDTVDGGAGADTLLGGRGNNTLQGGSEDDYLFGGEGHDALYGGTGNDRLIGGIGDDTLQGGKGNDYISSGEGRDIAYGNAGNDVLSGNDGNDELYGGDGDDILAGGEGDDLLVGGAGNDTITTGAGADVIRVNNNSGHDFISGLSGVDTIEFNGLTRNNVVHEILNNGTQVKLSWGFVNGIPLNSLTLNKYTLETQLDFMSVQGAASREVVTIRDLFGDIGLSPDASFAFLGAFDTQQSGDVNAPVKMVVGTVEDDELFGGPHASSTEPAYSYVLGRAGDDSLAGGISGSLLDGGTGNDKLLAVNNTVIVRDTLRGGVDTLVMPEGITPEQLIFTRVFNPLELRIDSDFWNLQLSVIKMNIQSMGLTEFQKMYALRGSWEENENEHAFEGLLDNYKQETSKYHNASWNKAKLNAHLDTLRIQTFDGKLTVDIANYFDEDNLKNDIQNVIFTTAFDNDGNSLDIKLEKLITEQQGVSIQKLDATYVLGSWGILLNTYAEFSGGSGSIVSQSYTAGTEIGEFLEGTVGFDLVDSSGRYWDYWNNHTYDSEIISYSQYQHAIDRRSDIKVITNGWPDYTVTGYSVTFANKTIAVDKVDNARVHAVGLMDVLYGFGGDDIIDAGGAFFEARYIASANPEKFSGSLTHLDYIFNPSNYYEEYYLNDFKDIVNGGSGDDRYIYRRDYGILLITDLDIPNAGAGGIDTLDMTEFNSNEVYFHQLRENGAFYLSSLSDQYDSYKLGVNVEVKGGIHGDIQVDRIVFSDRTIEIKALIDEWRDEGRLLGNDGGSLDANGQITVNSIYAAKPEGYQSSSRNLIENVNSEFIISGSPAGDDVFIDSDNMFVNGYEGSDSYFINHKAVTFGVIQMDKADIITIITGSDFLKAESEENSVFYYFPDSLYAGKSKIEWMAKGVFPQDNGLSRIFGAFSFNMQGVLGYLKPLENGADQYSLNDWVSVSADNDIGTDLLVNWRTTDVNGEVTEHHIILADVINSWGDRFNGLDGYHLAGYGTMGDDILSSRDSLGVVNNNYITSLDSNGAPAVSVSTFLSKETLSGALYGRGGNDILIGYARETQVSNAEGSGTSFAISEDDIFYGGSGNDRLDGNGGDDYLFGGEGIDSISGGDGNDWLDGGAGTDNLIGGNGDDTYLIDSTDSVIENIDGGIDEIQADFDLVLGHYANIENGRLLSNDATLTLIGNSGDNRLQGNGAGNVLTGLMGDDSYIVTHEDDTIIEAVDEGQDTVLTTVDILRLANNVENIVSNGINLNLFGNNLDNWIVGDIGDNLLDGYTGNDSLQGGEGNDEYVVDSQGDSIIELAGQGYDVVWTENAYTLSEVDNDIEEMRTHSNAGVMMSGNSLNNKLVGGDGNDTLNGAAGIDTLIGGQGNDIYIVDNRSDIIHENANAGIDKVESSARLYRLNDNVENITLINNGVVGFGNGLDNILVGNANNNFLFGFDGNDSLFGGAGIDWLYGLTGKDRLKGGDGNDSLYGGLGADRLEGGDGDDILHGGGEGDILIGGVGEDTYKFSNQDLINGSLNSQNMGLNEIRGDSDDTLEFTDLNSTDMKVSHGGWSDEEDATYTRWHKRGDDHKLNIMFSRKDNVAGSVVIWDFFKQDGAGGRHQLGSVTFADGVVWAFNDIKQELLKGSSYGDYITGYSTDDVIFGYAGNDRLKALGGNDILIGGAGYDSLYGGEGNDTYLFGRGDGVDRIIEYNTSPDNDLVEFTNGIDYSQLWFTHKTGTNDLEVSIIGTDDKVLINNWYGNTGSTIDQFTTQDNGLTLLESHVENLVSAMAAFNPPAAGETVLPPEYQSSIAPVLAANWQ